MWGCHWLKFAITLRDPKEPASIDHPSAQSSSLLIRVKLDTVGLPYELQGLWEESDVLQRVWADDLRQLMRDVPPFDTMFRELRALFEERMPRTLADMVKERQ